MPCILPSGELNGISVPAICARHGGQWVGEQQPSLMNEISSLKSIDLSQPVNTSYNDFSGALENSNIMNYIPIGAGSLGKGSALIKKIIPKFSGQPNTINQVQKAVQPFRGPVQQKMTDIASGVRNNPTNLQKLDSGVYKAAQYVTENPIKSTVAATSVGIPAYKGYQNIFDGSPVADKKVVPQVVPNTSTSPLLTMQDRKARNIALAAAQNAGDTATVDKILKGGSVDSTKPTNLWADRLKNLKPDARDDMALEGSLMNNPEAIKGMAKSDIPDSIWDKMQTKGFWMDGVEGGAGKWDNKLFRLGEMMSYMGTPLSKRGDSPAKRWTSANTEASKIKQAISKASGVANSNLTKAEQVEKWKLISASEVPESVLADLFYNKGMFDSDADAKRNAAGAIGVYKSVRSKLLEAGRTPTHQDVLAEIKRLRGTKV